MANSLPFLVTACTVPGPLTRRDHGRRGAGALPVFGDVEGPFKSQVSLLVVVDERGHGIVVATGEHARGGVLFLEALGVERRLVGVRGVASLEGASVSGQVR